MIEGRVLEAVTRDHTKMMIACAEPEEHRVQQVRAEIRQHAGVAIAPRAADVARGAVAVEHAAPVGPAQPPGVEQRLHPHEARLEAVVVGGIADDGLALGHGRQRLQRALVGRHQRLLDEHVLAVAEQVAEELELGGVGCADQRRLERVERHLRERPEAGAGMDRIDRRHHVGAGDGETLRALDA